MPPQGRLGLPGGGTRHGRCRFRPPHKENTPTDARRPHAPGQLTVGIGRFRSLSRPWMMKTTPQAAEGFEKRARLRAWRKRWDFPRPSGSGSGRPSTRPSAPGRRKPYDFSIKQISVTEARPADSVSFSQVYYQPSKRARPSPCPAPAPRRNPPPPACEDLARAALGRGLDRHDRQRIPRQHPRDDDAAMLQRTGRRVPGAAGGPSDRSDAGGAAPHGACFVPGVQVPRRLASSALLPADRERHRPPRGCYSSSGNTPVGCPGSTRPLWVRIIARGGRFPND